MFTPLALIDLAAILAFYLPFITDVTQSVGFGLSSMSWINPC